MKAPITTILCLLGLMVSTAAPGAEYRVVLKGGKLSLALSADWKAIPNRPLNEETLGAFQSKDNTSSLFVSTVQTAPDLGLPGVLDEVITNFENGLVVNHIGKTREGRIAGVNAVFCTLEIDLPSATTREKKPFRFYLTLFEAGRVVYLIQGSVQQPVKKEREAEILAIIRSVKTAG